MDKLFKHVKICMFLGLLKPPNMHQPVNYKPLAAHTGKNLFVVSEFFELFHFDLVTNVWHRLPSNSAVPDTKRKTRLRGINPIKQGRSLTERRIITQHLNSRRGANLVICDKTLYVTGGEDPDNINDNLLISYYNLPKKLDWSIERLLWLACFKNNLDRDKCFLSQCPPMIVYKIISYVNSDIFIM